MVNPLGQDGVGQNPGDVPLPDDVPEVLWPPLTR